MLPSLARGWVFCSASTIPGPPGQGSALLLWLPAALFTEDKRRVNISHHNLWFDIKPSGLIKLMGPVKGLRAEFERTEKKF